MNATIQTGRGFYELEVSKYSTCPLDPKTDESHDPRYTPIIKDEEYLNLTEWSVLSENKIAKQLSRMSSYKHYVPNAKEIKSQVKFNIWTRPTTPWKLECEKTVSEFMDKSNIKLLDARDDTRSRHRI